MLFSSDEVLYSHYLVLSGHMYLRNIPDPISKTFKLICGMYLQLMVSIFSIRAFE